MSNDINIIQEVQDSLDIYVSRKVLSKETLEKVPALVKRAVNRLKRKDLLPTRVIDFTSGDKKEEKRDNDGDLLYNYYALPTDFRKLEELFVGDNDVPYVWTPHENYIERISKFRSGGFLKSFEATSDSEASLSEFHPYHRLFTIKDINFSDIGESQKVMLLYPFPDDDEYIKISYHVSGRNLDYLEEAHIEPIIREVESILGLRSPQDSENETMEVINEWRERQGLNSTNRTYPRTRTTFFGKWNNRHDRLKKRR